MASREKELLELWEKADSDGKTFMLQTLFCFTTFGEPFYKEIQALLEKEDREGMKEAVQKWIKTATKKGSVPA